MKGLIQPMVGRPLARRSELSMDTCAAHVGVDADVPSTGCGAPSMNT